MNHLQQYGTTLFLFDIATAFFVTGRNLHTAKNDILYRFRGLGLYRC